MQACGFVFGGGYEVGSVEGELEVGYLHAVFVGGGVVEAVAGLGVYNILVWLSEGRGGKRMEMSKWQGLPLRRIGLCYRLHAQLLCSGLDNSSLLL